MNQIHNRVGTVDTEPVIASANKIILQLDSGDERYVWNIDNDSVIGRDQACDKIVHDPLVSRRHLKVTRSALGWSCEDLKSRSGTTLNGTVIQSIEELRTGDILQLGTTSLSVALIGKEAESLEDILVKVRALLVEEPDEDQPLSLRIRSAAEVLTDPGRIEEVVRQAIGLGSIEKLLADDEISEIMINGTHSMYLEKHGVLECYGEAFQSESEVRKIAERIAQGCGRKIDERSPLMDGRLADGSRVHIAFPPVSIDGPVITIRKFQDANMGIKELLASGSITKEGEKILQELVEQKKNLVVSGGTGTGKTTLLNVLSSWISAHERVVTVEDSAELRLRQPHVIRLETRPPRPEGAPAISIRELVRNALRMRPDRIVVGECRGGEALDMIQAMNTGHDGSLTTVHANSPRDALSRIEVMCLFAGLDLPLSALRRQIVGAVEAIVQVKRRVDGKRGVREIMRVDQGENDLPVLHSVYKNDFYA